MVKHQLNPPLLFSPTSSLPGLCIGYTNTFSSNLASLFTSLNALATTTYNEGNIEDCCTDGTDPGTQLEHKVGSFLLLSGFFVVFPAALHPLFQTRPHSLLVWPSVFRLLHPQGDILTNMAARTEAQAHKAQAQLDVDALVAAVELKKTETNDVDQVDLGRCGFWLLLATVLTFQNRTI